jgi:hypothetical protein
MRLFSTLSYFYTKYITLPSLVYIVDDKRVIGYDNGEGKGDHRHYKDNTEPYLFKDLRTLVKDFYRDIEKYKEGRL